MSDTIETITGVLSGLLGKYAKPGSTIKASTNLVADLGLESVSILEFVVDVEDHYDLNIDIESLSDVHTVLDMAQVVARLQNR
ncbi:MAG: acyl carrier protein [Gammaproteobacteria bacterium]|nr:acyl carrier protein [Gammaproteobacteria bacterium]